ncbi:hypothetical protein [Acidipropionibacterium acidipropionici]|uniref:hypothetical protein n=1 Tax=Acidipropionibacterium acidipropionici TaxID=1748 RepID=UPI00040FAF91|nr:hypothetical protein [Acidipropionibacterium acidipropionici]ALN14371.1 hypothetical protein ASQ49_02770 [Acidipropionibacterium acidipropionici]APZ09868.1 hypothetical protein BWX38_12180 [Acidipropionibacterium acidipropionici]
MAIYRSRTPVMHHWRRHPGDLLSACGQCPGHSRVADCIDTDHDARGFLEFAVIARDKAAHGLICPKCASLVTGIPDTGDAHLFLTHHDRWTRLHDMDHIETAAARITAGRRRAESRSRATHLDAGPAPRRRLPISGDRPDVGS